MGVEARYYASFAEALSRQGILVAICELRGHGSSSVRPRHGVDFGYREVVELDIPATGSLAWDFVFEPLGPGDVAVLPDC